MQLAAGGTSLHLFRITSENSAVGLFANRNHQAVLMACALPILAALASIQRIRKSPQTVICAFAPCRAAPVMGVAATGSRMGLLLGSVGLIAAATIYLVTSRGPGRSIRAPAALDRHSRVRNCRDSAASRSSSSEAELSRGW